MATNHSTGSKQLFHFGRFRVPNILGRFEALNDVVLGIAWARRVIEELLFASLWFYCIFMFPRYLCISFRSHINPDQAENPSTSQPKKILQRKPLQEKVNDKKQGEVKDSQENRKEIITKDTDKTQSAFSLENELSKIKIPIPFGELLKNS